MFFWLRQKVGRDFAVAVWIIERRLAVQQVVAAQTMHGDHAMVLGPGPGAWPKVLDRAGMQNRRFDVPDCLLDRQRWRSPKSL